MPKWPKFGYSLFLVTCDPIGLVRKDLPEWTTETFFRQTNYFLKISHFLCKINIWFIRKIVESILEIMEFSRTGIKWNMKIILSKYMTMSHCTSWHPTLATDESAWINMRISDTNVYFVQKIAWWIKRFYWESQFETGQS